MTVDEAKKELWEIKVMEKDIKAVELEIERLMTIATKMTPGYDVINTQGSQHNRIEEALIKIEEYRSRLSNLMIENLDYKNKCLDKVRKIHPSTLGTVLKYYFFMNYTMERTAFEIGKSYQWTYSMYQTALEEYCKVSEST